MKKYKGYDVIDQYPDEGWLKGYFYLGENDTKHAKKNKTGAYRDLGYIKYKDYFLHLLNINHSERVFDIGCADGAMMVYCGLLGAEVYGIDLLPDRIEKANKYLNKYNIKGKAILGDARKIDFPDNYFDKIVSSDFFEHLKYEDSLSVLKELKRVLKVGGMLFIKTPNLTYLGFSKIFKQVLRLIKFRNPFVVIIPHTTGNNPQHIGLKTRQELIRLIKSAGFMNFRFFYNTNSKVERLSYSMAELCSEIHFVRDIFTEDLTVAIYKPIITSIFA